MAPGQAIPGDTLSAAATRNRAARLRLRFFADNSVSSTTTHSGEESRGDDRLIRVGFHTAPSTTALVRVSSIDSQIQNDKNSKNFKNFWFLKIVFQNS